MLFNILKIHMNYLLYKVKLPLLQEIKFHRSIQLIDQIFNIKNNLLELLLLLIVQENKNKCAQYKWNLKYLIRFLIINLKVSLIFQLLAVCYTKYDKLKKKK